MVTVKTEISEKSWINSRTEEDDITQHEATSKYQLSVGITDSGDTPDPPPQKYQDTVAASETLLLHESGRYTRDHEKKLALLEKQNSERLTTTRQGKDTFTSEQSSNTASPSEDHLCPHPSCSKHYDELRIYHMQLALRDEQKKRQEKINSIQPEESQSRVKDKAQIQENQLCIRPLISGSGHTLENNKVQMMYVEQANNEKLASAHLRPEEISKSKTVDYHESHDLGMVKRESSRGFNHEGYQYMRPHEEENKEQGSALSQKEAAEPLRFKGISEIPVSQQPPQRSQYIPTHDSEPSSQGLSQRHENMQSNQQHNGKFIQKILPKPMPPPPIARSLFAFGDVSAPYARSSSSDRLQSQKEYEMQLMLLEQQNKKRLMMARAEQDEGNTSSKRIKAEPISHHLQPQKDLEPQHLKDSEVQSMLLAYPDHRSSIEWIRRDPNPQGLKDYEVQLMLLEQQNKKRLMIARGEQDKFKGSSTRVKVESISHHLQPQKDLEPQHLNDSEVQSLLLAYPDHRSSIERIWMGPNPQDLKDYGMQLRFLEQQNKKRLMMQRAGPVEFKGSSTRVKVESMD